MARHHGAFITSAKPTVGALIEALRPFAEYGVVYGEKFSAEGGSPFDRVPDGMIAVRGTSNLHCIKVGDLRRAARLYYANGGDPITPSDLS